MPEHDPDPSDTPDARAEVFDIAAFGAAVADRLIERGVFLPALMRVPDVAHYLQVHERAVRKQISLGKIPAVKPGRDWLILRDAWLERLQEQALAQLPPVALLRRS